MKIFKTTDKVKVKFDGVEVTLSPLSYGQRVEIMSERPEKQALLMLKMSIKGISGLEGYDGKPYELKLETDQLTDACASEIANAFLATKFSTILGRVNAHLFDVSDLEGVELEIVPN